MIFEGNALIIAKLCVGNKTNRMNKILMGLKFNQGPNIIYGKDSSAANVVTDFVVPFVGCFNNGFRYANRRWFSYSPGLKTFSHASAIINFT